jgi:N-acetylglucosamine kinase-like BadF-type ATPase
MRFTPENITHLEPNQIFVYGSNAAHRHGAGAAKLALKWGAKHGIAGLVGQTYGIPTKDKKIQTLPLDKIQVHVDDFLSLAFSHQEYEFLVTAVGTGLAGYHAKDIAPLFKIIKTGVFENVILPEEFYKYI